MRRHITLTDDIIDGDPEREPTITETVSFDPDDPASVWAARCTLQRKLGLRRPPPLGSPTPPGIWRRLMRRLSA